jgi:hypothetical protein
MSTVVAEAVPVAENPDSRLKPDDVLSILEAVTGKAPYQFAKDTIPEGSKRPKVRYQTMARWRQTGTYPKVDTVDILLAALKITWEEFGREVDKVIASRSARRKK